MLVNKMEYSVMKCVRYKEPMDEYTSPRAGKEVITQLSTNHEIKIFI